MSGCLDVGLDVRKYLGWVVRMLTIGWDEGFVLMLAGRMELLLLMRFRNGDWN